MAASGPRDPLSRMHSLAARLGICVVDDRPDPGRPPWARAAASVSFGEHIALSSRLGDAGLRADVLAMALIVAAVMGDTDVGHPCAIAAPGGLVLISATRVLPPGDGPGRLATLLARACGRNTPSAAFEYTVAAVG
jgi:hypothetical protein